MEEEIPRRLRRFQRQKKEEQEKPETEKVGQGKGFEAIPSEKEIEEGMIEKKRKAKIVEDIESALEREKQEDIVEGIDRRELAKELTQREVRRFSEQHNRLPMRTEYDQIVESIFSLMQKEERKEREKQEEQRRTEREKRKKEELEKREQRRRGRGRKKEEELPEILPEKPKVKLGIEDLEVKNIFGKGEKEEELELEGEGKEGEFSLKELEKEEKEILGKCENCGRETEKQVYCSNCGNPFCEKCAKIVKQVGKQLEMVCPHCGTKTRK